MRPKLLLHVGTHKTATTTQQRSLARDRGWLAARGVFYPDSAPFLGGPAEAHHRLAHLIAELDGPPDAVRAFLEDTLARASDHQLTVLSAEAFCRHGTRGWEGPRDLEAPSFAEARRAYLARLATLLSGFDVTVLSYFRQVESYAHAHYKQSLFEGVIGRTLEEDVAANPQRFQYDHQLAFWREAFGDVRARPFEPKREGGPYAALLSECGLPPSPAPGLRARPSPSNAAARWMLRRGKGERVPAWLADKALGFALSEGGEAVFARRGGSLWRSGAAGRAFAERYVSAAVPGANAEPDDVRPPCPWGQADHLRAEARFAAWRLRDRLGR